MRTMYYHRRKFFFAPLAIIGLALFSWVTMLLWNALLPAIFNFSVITFWQALGLLVLARLLFGGWHRPWRNNWHRPQMNNELRKKIKNMSPEDRKEFFRKMHYNRTMWKRDYCSDMEHSEEISNNEK